ncbi:hypothetical protein V5O48_006701 [Marasmius crinis-equi]|uniref:F-box domain-containing protein n=1 Tax=Marasmius crinis-equi TaxID=585013 RepID=A0ABR3FJ11_9AGAR
MSTKPPFSRLPTELIHYIFRIACENGSVIEAGNSFREHIGMPTPVVLSFVCSRWRDIAISLPTLWSTLALDETGLRFQPYHDEDWQKEAESNCNKEEERCYRIVQMFLERAGNSLLSLSFDSRGDSDLDLHCTWDALCSRVTQWRNVVFRSHRSFLEKDAFKTIRGKLLNLRGVTFIVDDANELAMVEFLGPCPSLRYVRHDVAHDSIPRSANPPDFAPWKHVTNLRLELSSDDIYDEALRIVSLCSSLIDLHLEFWEYRGSTSSHASVSYVSQVQSLCLDTPGTCWNPYFEGLLTNIEMPNLKSLRIWGEPLSDSRTFTKGEEEAIQTDELFIIDFICRSSCAMTSLSLDYTEFHDILMLFRLLTGLKSLSVREKRPTSGLYTARILENLVPDPTSPPFLPRLANLRLVVYRSTLEHPAFVEAILSRWNASDAKIGIDRFESVSIAFIDGFRSGMQCLETLKSARVPISLPQDYGAASWIKSGPTWHQE